MAVATHQNCRLYVGAYDLSGDANEIAVANPADVRTATVFTHTAPNNVIGLYNPTVTGGGFVQFGTTSVDTALKTGSLGLANVPVTVSPEAGAAGDVAVFLPALTADYAIAGKVGDVLPFRFSAAAQGVPAVAGRIFVAAGAKTTTGVSTILQLGAVAATQKVYASLHVLAASGTTPTLNVTVKSAAAVGFASPTTRITFTQKTTTIADFQSAAGPITDQYWRVDYTVGGTGPSFSFVVAVGIF